MLFQDKDLSFLKPVEGETNVAKFQGEAPHGCPGKPVNQPQPSSELQTTWNRLGKLVPLPILQQINRLPSSWEIMPHSVFFLSCSSYKQEIALVQLSNDSSKDIFKIIFPASYTTVSSESLLECPLTHSPSTWGFRFFPWLTCDSQSLPLNYRVMWQYFLECL